MQVWHLKQPPKPLRSRSEWITTGEENGVAEMIYINQLTEESVGEWVEYRGAGGEKERGRIKSWNEEFVFVVYKCNNEWDRFQNFTGQATRHADLHFVDGLEN